MPKKTAPPKKRKGQTREEALAELVPEGKSKKQKELKKKVEKASGGCFISSIWPF